jgi:hypothetical protein
MFGKWKKELTKYFNCVLSITKQGYNFVKLQNLSEQNDFVSKLVILANQTFKYIIDLKIT